MYCKNCGKEIDNNAYVCPYCGFKTVETKPETNGMAIAGLVCAFFIPLLGLIFGCIGLQKSKELGGEGRGMSIAAIVISVVWMVIAVLIIIITVIMTAAVMSSMTAPAAILAL